MPSFPNAMYLGNSIVYVTSVRERILVLQLFYDNRIDVLYS